MLKPEQNEIVQPGPYDDLILPSRSQHPLWRQVLLFVGAVVFMVLGIVFWLIPIVTGIPFWIVAFIMLAMVSHRARRGINWFDRKLPRRVRVALRHGRDRVHQWRERWTAK